MFAWFLVVFLAVASGQEVVPAEPLVTLDSAELSDTDWGAFPANAMLPWSKGLMPVKPDVMAARIPRVDTVRVRFGRPRAATEAAYASLPTFEGMSGFRTVKRGVRDGRVLCMLISRGSRTGTIGACAENAGARHARVAVYNGLGGAVAAAYGVGLTAWAASEQDPFAWLVWGISGAPVVLLSAPVMLLWAGIHTVAARRASQREERRRTLRR